MGREIYNVKSRSEVYIVLRILRVGDCEPGNGPRRKARATVAKTLALRSALVLVCGIVRLVYGRGCQLDA